MRQGFTYGRSDVEEMEEGLQSGFAISLVALVGLAACTPAADEVGGTDDTAAVERGVDESDNPAPDTFGGTAWRVTAEDGARYVTLLDADGAYRDLRNGDPWQTGNWTYADGPGGKQLCFVPDHENGLERCWQPGRISDDTMVATGPGERRIELTRVEYRPPAVEVDQEAE